MSLWAHAIAERLSMIQFRWCSDAQQRLHSRLNVAPYRCAPDPTSHTT
jgi:hypothetical protein